MEHEEVANEIARLERQIRGEKWKAIVVDLTKPLKEIESELSDENDREFVRYVKAHGLAQIAIISVGTVNL